MPNEFPTPLDFYSRRSRELISDVAAAKSSLSASRASLVVLVLIAAALCYESFIAKTFPLWLPAAAIPFAAAIGRQIKRANARFLTFVTLADYYEKGTARLHAELGTPRRRSGVQRSRTFLRLRSRSLRPRLPFPTLMLSKNSGWTQNSRRLDEIAGHSRRSSLASFRRLRNQRAARLA